MDEASGFGKDPDMMDAKRIDLHGLSYGEVYFGLKRRFEAELRHLRAEPIKLELIIGKGLHSHAAVDVSGAHPIKQAVDRLLQELSFGVTGIADKTNPEIMRVLITGPRPRASVVLGRSMFGAGSGGKMNPEAPAFVPRTTGGRE